MFIFVSLCFSFFFRLGNFSKPRDLPTITFGEKCFFITFLNSSKMGNTTQAGWWKICFPNHLQHKHNNSSTYFRIPLLWKVIPSHETEVVLHRTYQFTPTNDSLWPRGGGVVNGCTEFQLDIFLVFDCTGFKEQVV